MRAPLRAADIGVLYDGYHAAGLQYGPSYRTLVQAWGGASSAWSHLRSRVTQEGTHVHPADLDDALCTSGVMASNGEGGGTRLPFAVDDAQLQSAAGKLCAVRLAAETSRIVRSRLACIDAEMPVLLITGCGSARCRGDVGALGHTSCCGFASTA